MSKDLVRQLKNLKHGEINPRQEWQENSRALLLSQIKNTVAPVEEKFHSKNIWTAMSVFVPRSLVYNVLRPALVFLLVLTIGSSSWIATVEASYDSLPGDWLYPAKRVAEKTQMAVTSMVGGKNAETKLHVEFAKRRASEVKKIVRAGDPQKQTKISATVSDLKKEMTSVSDKLGVSSQPSDQNLAAETVKEVKQQTEQIGALLKEVKNDLVIASVGAIDTTSTKELSKELNDAKNLTKATEVRATEAMVVEHLSGSGEVSKEEASAAVKSVITSMVADAVESKESVTVIKDVVETAKQEIKELSGTAVAASTTKELADKITDVSDKTKTAAEQVQTITSDVDKKVGEATTLLNSGELTGAVNKIKEAEEGKQQAEKITDEIIVTAKEVLPVAKVATESGVTVVSPVIAITTSAVEAVNKVVTGTAAATVGTSTVKK